MRSSQLPAEKAASNTLLPFGHGGSGGVFMQGSTMAFVPVQVLSSN